MDTNIQDIARALHFISECEVCLPDVVGFHCLFLSKLLVGHFANMLIFDGQDR